MVGGVEGVAAGGVGVAPLVGVAAGTSGELGVVGPGSGAVDRGVGASPSGRGVSSAASGDSSLTRRDTVVPPPPSPSPEPVRVDAGLPTSASKAVSSARPSTQVAVAVTTRAGQRRPERDGDDPAAVAPRGRGRRGGRAVARSIGSVSRRTFELRSSEWLYIAVPTVAITLTTTAPRTVPATPSHEDATAAEAAASAPPTIWGALNLIVGDSFDMLPSGHGQARSSARENGCLVQGLVPTSALPG